MSLETLFNKAWYEGSKWTYLLSPITPLVSYLVKRKRAVYLAKKMKLRRLDVPIVVVGNLTVGGTGKSPMVLALIKALRQLGYKPGIVSRGYGVDAKSPVLVTPQSLATQCGDEPVMLARRSLCPLVICQQRVKAVTYLLEQCDVDVVISDDGMQHYAMTRDIEVMMLDAKRGLGNGCLLPVGPLREPASRLREVDYIVGLISATLDVDISEKQVELQQHLEPHYDVKQQDIKKVFAMPLKASELINLSSGERVSLDLLASLNNWQVVAGIGNPERFLQTLIELGLSSDFQAHWFGDHHEFADKDICFDQPVVMTEKDAVKCKDLSIENNNIWYLPVEVELAPEFIDSITDKIKAAKLSIGNKK